MTRNIYRISIVIGGLLYVAFWFAPAVYGIFPEDTRNLLAYHGYGALIQLPMWAWWLYLGITISAYIGMFFLRKVFRALFVLVIAAGLAMEPALGVNITPGATLFMVDLSTFLQGFVLAIAYLTPLNNEFS